MTTPPNNFTPSHEAPEPPAPRSPRGAVLGITLAWLLILASAAALVVRPRFLDRGTGTPADLPPSPAIALTPSTQLQIIGRYAVGTKALLGERAPSAQLLEKVDDAVANPVDEFRAIPVAAELSGDHAALDRLDAFEQKHPVVRLRKDVDALRALYTGGPGALEADQRELLVANHHWFGQLALARGLPADDPQRAAAIKPAARSVIVIAAAGLLGFAAFFAGIVLLIVAIMLAVQRRLRRAYRPPPRPLAGPLVEVFALYLLTMVFGSQLLARLFPDAGLWINFPLILMLPLAALYLRLRGLTGRDTLAALGWHRGQGFLREVGVGFVGYLAGLPVLGIGLVVTFFLMKYTGNAASHPIVNQPLDRPRDVLAIVLLAAVWAPILEETMFRGALFSHLRALVPWWVAAPIVSVLFAAIHPQGWVAIPVLASIALVFAALREWRGSLVAPIVAHAINNGIAVLMLVTLMR